MSPQEKAKELVDKYKDAPFNCVGCDMPFCDAPCTMLNIDESKQCALITVDEVIKNISHCYEDCFNHDHWEGGYDIKLSNAMISYWKKVKEEIEKL